MIHQQLPNGKCITTNDDGTKLGSSVEPEPMLIVSDELAKEAKELIDYLDSNIFISPRRYSALRQAYNNYNLMRIIKID